MFKLMNCYLISLISIPKTVKTLIHHFHEIYWCIQTSKYTQRIFTNTMRVTEIHSNSFSQQGNEKQVLPPTRNKHQKKERKWKKGKGQENNKNKNKQSCVSLHKAQGNPAQHRWGRHQCPHPCWSCPLEDGMPPFWLKWGTSQWYISYLLHTQRTTATAFEEAVLG